MHLSMLLLAPALVAQAPTGPAQLKPLRVSPLASVTQELGISSLRIDYHRPAVKGRTIWGDLVPFDQVWRAGANEATRITFSDPAKVDGHEIPAGSYGFFVIPGKETWTLIFNRQAEQWGAYAYKPDTDVLRLQIKPRSIPHQEYLLYDVQVTSPVQMRVELRWAGLAGGFDVDYDVKGLYWKHIEDTLAQAKPTEWKPWFQAADYCRREGIQPEKALAWIDTSLKAEENASNLECKARLLQKAGRTKEALPCLDKALQLARGKAPKEYVEGLEKTRREWTEGSR